MNDQVRVRLEPIGKDFLVRRNTPFKDILSGLGVEFPCGGKGRCGGCKIRILEGHLPLDPLHLKQLKDLRLEKDFRLACKSKVAGDIVIEILQFHNIILSDNSSFNFVPEQGYGIAFDLGTSTLAAQLVNLETGYVQDVETRLNPQSAFGADLISRTEHALFNDGQQELTGSIRQAFKEMVNQLIQPCREDIRKIIIVGNTVMHHLFDGLDLKPLSAYPFESPFDKALHFSADELGLNCNPHCSITFLQPMGSFVGSDILAGILATKLYESTEIAALVDLGTNGEIALGNRDRIIFASTAAGPAFEGTNISCGMHASTGAISSVNRGTKGIEYHVIGNETARGICGSGLIDLVAVLLSEGKIDAGGAITNGSRKIELSGKVFITQKDIREFQLAKAAIATGLELLANRFGTDIRDIDKIFIAGAFGNFINLENTRITGMLNHPVNRIYKTGNSALLGAKMMLFKKEDALSGLVSISEHYSLESHPGFQDGFARNMMFGRG